PARPSAKFVDSGTSVSFSYPDPVASTVSGKRYALVSTDPSSPVSVTAPTAVSATYKTQYRITFNQSGLSSDATGTVVTIDTVDKGFTDLPFAEFVDSGTSVSFTYADPVASSVSGTRYALVSVDPSSPVTVPGPTADTGTYKPQYRITFSATGLGGDTTGTIVTVDSAPQSAVPYAKYVDAGTSVSFSYADPVASTVSGKRYALVSTDTSSPVSV